MSSEDLRAGIEIGTAGAVLTVSDDRRLRFDLSAGRRGRAEALESVAAELFQNGESVAIHAVIAGPSVPDQTETLELRESLRGGLEGSLIVSKPFATAYTLNSIEHALVIDLGARYAEIGLVLGSYPQDGDSVCVPTAGGRTFDALLLAEIQNLHPSEKLTLSLMRSWKEAHGFAGPRARRVVLRPFPESAEIDITDAIWAACERIVEPIAAAVRDLLAGSASRERADLRDNVVLSGGTAWLKGLPVQPEAALRSEGGARVRRVKKPTFACAHGCLLAAKDLEADAWEQLATL